MAMKDGNEYYTHFTFRENGRSTRRRMHRLTIQTRDGQVHVFEKDTLPGEVVFESGFAHTDEHAATILGLPREKHSTSLLSFLPESRDWVYVIVGIASVVLVKALIILATTPY